MKKSAIVLIVLALAVSNIGSTVMAADSIDRLVTFDDRTSINDGSDVFGYFSISSSNYTGCSLNTDTGYTHNGSGKSLYMDYTSGARSFYYNTSSALITQATSSSAATVQKCKRFEYKYYIYIKEFESSYADGLVFTDTPCVRLDNKSYILPEEQKLMICSTDSGNSVTLAGADSDTVYPWENGNGWVEIKREFNFEGNTISTYVNGTLLLSTDVSGGLNAARYSEIKVMGADADKGIYFDDVSSKSFTATRVENFTYAPVLGSSSSVSASVDMYGDGTPCDMKIFITNRDTNNNITHISTVNGSLQSGETQKTVSFTVDFYKDDNSVRIFYFNKDNLNPMGSSKELLASNIISEIGLNGLALHTTKVYSRLPNNGNYERPSAETILNDYINSPQFGKHPRIMLTDEMMNTLKANAKNSSHPKTSLYNSVISRANTLRSTFTSNPASLLATYKKCFEDRMPGANNSGTAADQFKDRMMVLSFAYQATGDATYADAAWVMLERVMSFPDINPWHDLDFGFFCQGYAVAYDWMYDAWTPEQRDALEKAIIRQCFRPANDSFTNNSISRDQDSTNGVVRGVYTEHNHNPIVNSGIIMTALALMDKYQDITPSLCRDAFICLERDLNMYSPYGLTTEGTEYMLLSADNLAMAFSSLESAIGKLYGMDTCPGMADGKLMRVIHGMESSVGPFSFGDSYDSFLTYPGELWFDKHYDMQGFRTAIFDRIKGTSDYVYRVKLLCWYEPEATNTAVSLDRDMVIGEGTDYASSFATFRSDFTSNQTFVGVKAGNTERDYFVHLDQGSFVYHALGFKWATDMGKDDYNISGYMQPTASNNNRWKIFRLRPDGHNTLLIGPNTSDFGYEFSQTAELTTEISDTQAKAVIDMTRLVSSKASSSKRGFLLTDNRRSLVVRDELNLKKSYDLYWLMYVPSGISISINGNSATLQKPDGPRVKLDFAVSAEGEMYTESAAPWSLAPTVSRQNSNRSYTRLVYKITGAPAGEVNITAKLTPVITETSSAPDVSTYGSIDSWSVN